MNSSSENNNNHHNNYFNLHFFPHIPLHLKISTTMMEEKLNAENEGGH
jgi:hypothetical protein